MSDFTVPGISDADAIGDKPQTPLPKAFPGHVLTQPEGPSTWQKVSDFVPSAAKKRQILEARGLRPKAKSPIPTVRKLHGVDYMSYEDSQKLVKKKGSLIKRMAADMIKEREEEVRRYKLAEQIVAKSTPAQRKKPSPKLLRAMSILEKGPPITHKEALQQARERAFRESM